MKKNKLYTVLVLGLVVAFSHVSAVAEDDVSALLQSELKEIKSSFSNLANEAAREEVKNCLLTESNAVIDSEEFQRRLSICIKSELKPKTVKGITDVEAQCFSLRYGLVRSVTDKCAELARQLQWGN